MVSDLYKNLIQMDFDKLLAVFDLRNFVDINTDITSSSPSLHLLLMTFV